MKKLLLLTFYLLLTSCGIFYKKITPPEVTYPYQKPQITALNDTLRYFQDNYIAKNQQGLWELYLSGNPYQLGLNSGALTEPLYHRQDSLLFVKLNHFVPSERKQRFLRKFVKWFNRDINNCVIPPFRQELWGQAQYSDTIYNYIAPAYQRTLYLHSTHDLGHALQDLMLVGCSSLAVWGDKTEDGQLLIGRNFDFYLSDDFATEKVVRFVRPEEGIPFMSYAWGGMIGVLSGMNLEGLTVTINAGKSSIPLKARTPISLLCREILQYAKNIDEAIAIAKKRKVFVSEAIMVGSATDGKAVIIEVSPKKFGVYEAPNAVLCTNHFQSEVYKKDKKNLKQIRTSHSAYRYAKMQEFLTEEPKLNPSKIATLLRSTEGLHADSIGYGNEKALNQLLAHHAVIFKPQERLVWVSTAPYQLGTFVAYDLKQIFATKAYPSHSPYPQTSLNIPPDPFMYTQAFKDYEAYRVLEQQIETHLREHTPIVIDEVKPITSLNPHYWKAYYLLGRAYQTQGNKETAHQLFQKALQCEIPYSEEREKIQKLVNKN